MIRKSLTLIKYQNLYSTLHTYSMYAVYRKEIFEYLTKFLFVIYSFRNPHPTVERRRMQMDAFQASREECRKYEEQKKE